MFRVMSLPAIILLASLGPASTIKVPKMGTHNVFFKAAPRSGDLVREGLHPLALLISDHRHKADQFEKLYNGLGVGGFSRAALTLPKTIKDSGKTLEVALQWSLKQPQVDPERIYLISDTSAGIVAIQQAIKQHKGIQGLVWLSPVLKAQDQSVLPLLSKLSPMPIVLTADVRDKEATNAVNTLRTVLKMRFPDVRRIRRANLGRGVNQLQRSATLADQLIITLRTWAEKNCDRTAPKKKTLNEGCKK